MTMIYSNPKRANDEHALPNVEVFYGSPTMELVDGWYWWACLPGCLPDGEPNGPFDTEQEAIEDAQSSADDDAEGEDAENSAARLDRLRILLQEGERKGYTTLDGDDCAFLFSMLSDVVGDGDKA